MFLLKNYQTEEFLKWELQKLVIPFDSPERYHWWKPDGERLTVAQTMAEVKERVRAALATNEKD